MSTKPKLVEYIVEEAKLTFPKFPPPKARFPGPGKFANEFEFYVQKSDPNIIAMKWSHKTVSPGKKKRSVYFAFQIETSVVGIFDFGNSKLSKRQRQRFLQKEGTRTLYPLVKEILMPLWSRSLIKGAAFPALVPK